MSITIVFQNEKGDKHNSQLFQITKWEVHSSYNFLEIVTIDGVNMQFNMDRIFNFQVKN